jgi:hypothetical protein
MTLKNEELLSRYFERKMTSGEEQNFLISVAANDELRLAFRSQLELMRAVSNDKDGIRSAAEVRMRTLAALGLSTLAADSYLEHDLLSRPAAEEAKREVVIQAASSQGGFMNFIKSPVTTVVGGLAIGFMAAIAIFSSPEPEVRQPAHQQVPVPQVQAPGSVDLKLQETPQIQPNSAVLEQKRSMAAKPNVSAARKAAGETIAPNSGLELKANGTEEQPVVDRQNPSPIQVNPAKIKKPTDSTAKQ